MTPNSRALIQAADLLCSPRNSLDNLSARQQARRPARQRERDKASLGGPLVSRNINRELLECLAGVVYFAESFQRDAVYVEAGDVRVNTANVNSNSYPFLFT